MSHWPLRTTILSLIVLEVEVEAEIVVEVDMVDWSFFPALVLER